MVSSKLLYGIQEKQVAGRDNERFKAGSSKLLNNSIHGKQAFVCEGVRFEMVSSKLLYNSIQEKQVYNRNIFSVCRLMGL